METLTESLGHVVVGVSGFVVVTAVEPRVVVDPPVLVVVVLVGRRSVRREAMGGTGGVTIDGLTIPTGIGQSEG